MRPLKIVAIVACFATGCAVGPDFQKPEIPVPVEWSNTARLSASHSAVEWWKNFEDPVLESLLDRAITANFDMAIAVSRVRQARALVSTSQAPLFPWLSASGSFQRSGTGGGNDSVVVQDGLLTSRGGGGSVENTARAGLDVSWEIDLFGGIRRSIEAAEAGTEAAEEFYRDTLVIVRADVASGYFNLRGLQARLQVANDNAEAQERNAEIVRKRHANGFANSLELNNAEAQVASTRANIPRLQSDIRRQMHALAVLLGQQPSALNTELEASGKDTVVPATVPLLLPSEVMRVRPDVRKAEADLHASVARVGVAVAELFPKFTLSALLATQGSQLGMLDSWENRLWTVGAGLTQPIFQGGRIASEVERQKALRDESVAAYHATVLRALKEVEDALVAFTLEGDRIVQLEISVDRSRRALAVAEDLYTSGLTEFLEVLNAERTLYAAQETLVISRSQRAINMVILYKTLGGGVIPPLRPS